MQRPPVFSPPALDVVSGCHGRVPGLVSSRRVRDADVAPAGSVRQISSPSSTPAESSSASCRNDHVPSDIGGGWYSRTTGADKITRKQSVDVDGRRRHIRSCCC